MQNIIEREQTSLSAFPGSAGQEVERARAIQEVQGAIFMARQLPRDEAFSRKKIMAATQNLLFAERAIYAYPRGGSMIMGPSIRAAETLALNWGNLLTGTKILSQSTEQHKSELMVYCWDLESNVRAERIFVSSHIREKKSGNEIITSARDIYEKEANDSSRRLRACILAIIPNYITEEFVKNCEKRLLGNEETTLEERITALVNNFNDIGITEQDLKDKMGVSPEKFVAKNIVFLGHIYNSIKDGFAPASHFFKIEDKKQKEINETLKKLKRTKNKAEEKPAESVNKDVKVEQQQLL